MDMASVYELIGRRDRSVADVADELIDASDAELDERVRALELVRRRVEAELALTIAAVEDRTMYAVDGHRSVKGYLRATCNWSNADVAVHRRLATAIDVVPGLADALHSGRIGIAQATAIARVHRNPRVRDRLIEFAATLLDIAERHSFDEFHVVLARFEVLADADGAHRERDERIENRKVRISTAGGLLQLDATGGDTLVNEELEAIFARFREHEFRKDVAARRAEHGDDIAGVALSRTAGQRSYDAFVEALRRADASLDTVADAPKAPSPMVNITVDHRTLGLILADAGLAPTRGIFSEPIDPFTGLPRSDSGDLLADLVGDPATFAALRCETSRGTPLHPHDVLRAVLAGHVRRVVFDSHGVPIDMGRKQRLFTGHAREAAKLLVHRCEHAGCDLPAEFCQVDHVSGWVDGGPTDQHNAATICGHHNRVKEKRRFSSRRDTTGQRYTVRPDGTIIIPVGARPPTFPEEPDEETLRRRREDLAYMIETAEFTRTTWDRLRSLRRAS